MNNSEIVAEALLKIIASLIIGLIMAAAVKYAFEFTWPQAAVITWFYCLLKDSVDTVAKRLRG